MSVGFILIHKPIDWTSHDVVGYLRKITGIKKIGHAGTLDPFAEGLLIIGIGREATKRLDHFKLLDKTYRADIMLGSTSETLDRTGRLTPITFDTPPTVADIQRTLGSLTGDIIQTPPMYSAKKVGGVPLYRMARRGEVIDRAPHHVHIHSITLESYCFPLLTLTVVCSPGTYIRTLADDIGSHLLTGAYCHSLVRTAIGHYPLSNAVLPTSLDSTWQTHLFQIDS